MKLRCIGRLIVWIVAIIGLLIASVGYYIEQAGIQLTLIEAWYEKKYWN